MNENAQFGISTDRPLIDPKDDLLGFAPFAENIAKSIQNSPQRDGYVIGLYGEWGSGKSTLLNFVEHYLKQDINITVVRFNPWIYSDDVDLVTSFLIQLNSVLIGEKKQKANETIDRLVSKLTTFTKVISKLPLTGSELPLAIAEKISQLQETDINHLKSEIEEHLRTFHQIVVMIDDIDRLTSQEIREIFRLIKAVADFPNIIYFIAFDKKVVQEALESYFPDGERYLEKIIQLPIHVPVILESYIKRYLDENIEKTVNPLKDSSLFSYLKWEQLYNRWISQLFRNFRDARRYVNSIMFEYEAVRNEVDVLDFLILHILKLFFPDIHNAIREHRNHFTTSHHSFLSDPYSNKFQEFHKTKWLDNKDYERQVDIIATLLLALFPKLKNLDSKPKIFRDHYGSKSKQCRISDMNHFYTYFRNTLLEGQLSHNEYIVMLNASSDARTLSEQLISAKRFQLEEFLGKIRHDDNLISEQICIILQSFIHYGDSIVRSSGNNFRLFGIMLNIAIEFLLKMEADMRFSFLTETISAAEKNSFTIHLLIELQIFNSNRTYYGENLLSDIDFPTVRKILNAQIEDSFRDGSIFKFIVIEEALVKWYKFESELATQIFTDDTNFVNFIALFADKLREPNTNSYHFNFGYLREIYELESLIDRIRNLYQQNNWDFIQQSALKQFIDDFEQGLHKR